MDELEKRVTAHIIVNLVIEQVCEFLLSACAARIPRLVAGF